MFGVHAEFQIAIKRLHAHVLSENVLEQFELEMKVLQVLFSMCELFIFSLLRVSGQTTSLTFWERVWSKGNTAW